MVAPGTPIAPSTSIDALFSALFPTRSTDLGATPSYVWVDAGTIQANWPGSSNAMFARLEARPNAPSVLVQSGSGGGSAVTDSISAVLGGSFVVPAVGSSVSVTVAMPWVDVGDTVSINDGTRQFKGTVLGKTGTTLTLLNPGYFGNTASGGTMAASAVATLCGAPMLASDVIYDCDDFLFATWGTGAAAYKWFNTTTGAGVFAPFAYSADHVGVLKLGATTAIGAAYIEQQSGLGSGLVLASAKKVVARFIVMADASYESSGANGEWTFGFADNFPSVQYGALFSVAPGYTGLPGANGVGGTGVTGAGGILAGTYNNVATNHFGYIQTGFAVNPNIWYDFIISYSAAAVKFYGAVYGNSPSLLGTITDNITTTQHTPIFVTNGRSAAGSPAVNMYIDRIELLLQTNQPRAYLGENLLAF
jgi:hypothetical protein